MKTLTSLFVLANLCLASKIATAEVQSPAPGSAGSPPGAAVEPSASTDATASAPATEPSAPQSDQVPAPAPNAPATVAAPPVPPTPPERPTHEAAAVDEDHDEAEEDSLSEQTLDGDAGGSNGKKGTLGRFRMMLQLRYKHTYVDSDQVAGLRSLAHQQRATVQDSDGYDIQRAFMRYTARPVKSVEAKLLMDFAELRHNNVKQSFKLAYLQLHATKFLQFDLGLLKRTYSILELLPIVDHELADLGPTDSFIKDQGYAGRDIGAVTRVYPLKKRQWLSVSVGAFRGNLDEGYDEHPLKVMTARIETFPWKHLRIGVNGAWRPYQNRQMQELEDAAGDKYYGEVITLDEGKAAGVDASLIFKRLQVRVEGLYGERTDPLRKANHFASGWIVVAPNFKLGPVRLVPAGKLEVLDLDAENSGGRRVVATGVFGVVPVKNLRLLVDVTRTIVDDRTLAMSKVPWTKSSDNVFVNEPSSTSGTLQVQYQF